MKKYTLCSLEYLLIKIFRYLSQIEIEENKKKLKSNKYKLNKLENARMYEKINVFKNKYDTHNESSMNVASIY